MGVKTTTRQRWSLACDLHAAIERIHHAGGVHRMSTPKLLLLLLIGISVLGLRDVTASSIVFTSARPGEFGEIRLADIYVMSFDGGNVKQLTHTLGTEGSPTWSPDGKYILLTDTYSKHLDDSLTFSSWMPMAAMSSV